MKKNDSNPDDDKLIRRARKGDREAFEQLVRRYQRRVVGVALALTHNRDDAMDVAQEAFSKAYEKLGQFESRSSFSTWLYRIVANLATDFRRREMRHAAVHSQENVGDDFRQAGAAIGDLAFRGAARNELRERIQAALSELTPEHRTVILLREVEGLSYKEISEIVGCPLGTVMSRVHYARDRLRALLGEFDTE